jgi:hypothetical protein
MCEVGQDHINLRCMFGLFGREITKFMVIYGDAIRFWPTLADKHAISLRRSRPMPADNLINAEGVQRADLHL